MLATTFWLVRMVCFWRRFQLKWEYYEIPQIPMGEEHPLAMYELPKAHFYKVKNLIQDGHPYPEVLSVIEGNHPGWIFADDLEIPRTALIWSQGIGGFYLIGDPDNPIFIDELDRYITEQIVPRMKAFKMNYFEVSGHHRNWNMKAIFPSRELQQWEQLVFSSGSLKAVTLNEADDRFKTLSLRSREWRTQSFSNREFVEQHIDSFWKTREDFLEKGYGYIALEGEQITGVCYSSFVTTDTHAIGIETLGNYQKQGVGFQLARLVAKEISYNGYSVYWDCSLDNEASRKLANRLGLQQVYRYTCVGFTI
ncbi:GNAT family N-acetyltransferase [uncultured Brevibacillus sp.]|uniref:GNAT family N-acetyltransferase n=1 Tax=uncultured Brevibacillus sp. TaxID=169970 RepID=UPI002598AEA3|nr:GNAT family N-acetyltransferase [uncultured Brevibacillus sp.]